MRLFCLLALLLGNQFLLEQLFLPREHLSSANDGVRKSSCPFASSVEIEFACQTTSPSDRLVWLHSIKLGTYITEHQLRVLQLRGKQIGLLSLVRKRNLLSRELLLIRRAPVSVATLLVHSCLHSRQTTTSTNWVSNIEESQAIISNASVLGLKPLSEALIHVFDRHPDPIQFVLSDSETHTNAHVYALACSVAEASNRFGFQPFTGASILTFNSSNFFSLDIGVTLDPAFPVNIYTANKLQAISHILNCSRRRLIFVDDDASFVLSTELLLDRFCDFLNHCVTGDLDHNRNCFLSESLSQRSLSEQGFRFLTCRTEQAVCSVPLVR